MPYEQVLQQQGFVLSDIELLEGEFDSDFYASLYPDVTEQFERPLDHYVSYGALEGRAPCSWFDSATYLRLNPDVAQTAVNPFLHYLVAGRHEGRALHPPVDPERNAEAVNALPALERRIEASDALDGEPRWVTNQLGADYWSVASGLEFSQRGEPRLTVCIPFHNRIDLLLECLISLKNQTVEAMNAFDVIVIDDGSGSPDREILGEIKGLRVLKSGSAGGFAAACNRVLEVESAGWLLFLNSDVQLRPDALEAVFRIMAADMGPVVIGALLLNPDGSVQEDGCSLTIDGAASMVGYGSSRNQVEGSGDHAADFVSGAVLLTRRQDFQDLDGFSLGYGRGYGEDVDYCLRIRQVLGGLIRVDTNVVAVHRLSGSFGELATIDKVELSERGRLARLEQWPELVCDAGIKVIAFHLPQFHETPENNAWWGAGFTEWRNVGKARPNYPRHIQPRVPSELGYYRLDSVDTLRAQAALSKQYGIDAFCYYYYSFNGFNPLRKPLDLLLKTKDIDQEFCLAWANEPWTRKWDGGRGEVLLDQPMTDLDVIAAAEGMVPFLLDERYTRIEGRPLVLLYRLDISRTPRRVVDLMRNVFRQRGAGEVALAYVESFSMASTPVRPRDFNLDYSVEFPPHELGTRSVSPEGVNETFEGSIFDFASMVRSSLSRPPVPWTRFPGVCPGWDNTPRQQDHSVIFDGFSEQLLFDWVTTQFERVLEHPRAERLVFVNAWNEWAEGAFLEPDLHHGRSKLECIRAAKRMMGVPVV